MLIEHDLDAAALYAAKRIEFVRFLRSLPAADLGRTVPATPAWTVRDVLAHVVGITADLNDQRFGSGDPDEWTARQVDTRRGRSVDDMVDEWEREAPTFEEGLRIFGYELGSHYVADLLQHTADVHHALGRGGIADDDALTAGMDFCVDHLHSTLVAHGIGSIVIELPDERITVGTGSEHGTLTIGRFELFRAIGGRRSARQLRALRWTGGVDDVVDLLPATAPPEADLVETPG